MSSPNVVINSEKKSESIVPVKRKYSFKKKPVVKAQEKLVKAPSFNSKMHNSPAIKELESRRDALLANAEILTKSIDFLKADFML